MPKDCTGRPVLDQREIYPVDSFIHSSNYMEADVSDIGVEIFKERLK